MNQPAKTLLQNAKREAWLVVAVDAVALLWTVGVCYLKGYQHAPDSWVVEAGLASVRTASDFQQILGMPDWVFLGVFMPWIVAGAFTIGVCLGLKDDDLGADADEGGASHGH